MDRQTSRKTLWLLFLSGLYLFLNTGCDRLSNEISQVALDCGADADKSQAYVKVLDPEGLETNGRDLRIRYSSEVEVPATSRGCFSRSALNNGALVVSSRLENRVWGVIARKDEVPFLAEVKLNEQSAQDIEASCGSTQYTNGNLTLPVALPSDQIEAFPYRVSMIRAHSQAGEEAAVETSLALQGDKLALIPGTMPEGEFTLHIRYRNLFLPQSAEASRELTCAYVLDRDAPSVKASFHDVYKGDFFRVEPGEKLQLSTSDVNPLKLHSCMAPEGSDLCADKDQFQLGLSDASVVAPDAGYWCLSYWAEDKAGNSSAVQKSCFLAYQRRAISQIKTLVQSANLQLASDPLHAAVLVLKASKLLHELPTADEKAEVQGLVNSVLASVQGQSYELNRSLSDDIITSIEAWGDLFLIRRSNRIELHGSDGQLLDSLVVDGKIAFDPARKALLVYNAKSFVLYSVEQGFKIQNEWLNPGLGSGVAAAFDPKSSTILFTDDDQKVHFFQADQSGVYSDVQSMSVWGAENFSWSGDGSLLLTRFENGLQVWKRADSRHYEPLFSLDTPVYGAAFLSAEAGDENRLLYLKSDGGLWAWAEGAADQSLKTYAVPENGLSTEFLKASTRGQALIVIGENLDFLSLENGQVAIKGVKNPSVLKGLSLTQSALTGGLVSVRSANEVFQFKNDVGTGVWRLFSRLRVIDSSIATYAVLPTRIVTVDNGGRRLRLWSAQSILESFMTDATDSPSLRWLDASTLISSGFDGDSKFWTKTGELLKSWVHTSRSEQVNDLFSNQNQSVWVSVGEDGHVLVRDSQGTVLDDLNQKALAGTSSSAWIGTGLFADDNSRFMTAASGSLIIWNRDASGHYQAAHIIKDPDLGRTRSLPGDLQRFHWKGEELILIRAPFDGTHNFAIYDFEGRKRSDVMTQQGRMQAVDLAADGQRLALSRANGKVEIYQLEDQGFVLKAAVGDEQPWTRLQSLRWNPEGTALAGIFGQDRLLMWSYAPGLIRENATAYLETTSDGYYLPLWIGKMFLIRDGNSLYRYDTNLSKVSEWAPFARDIPISAVAYNEALQALAVEARGQVKLLPLSSDNLELQLCTALKSYLANSNEFGRVNGVSEDDRAVCSFLTP